MVLLHALALGGFLLMAPAPASLEETQTTASTEQNPWDAALWNPMYVPFPFDALLDGWVPWGRFAWVKNVTGGLFVGAGVVLWALFPVSVALVVVSLVLGVLGLALAAYFWFTAASHGDAVGMCNSGNDATQSCFSIYNGIMCLSFVACWPWLGFKLAQRGVYAVQADLPPTASTDAPPVGHQGAPPPQAY